MSAPGFTLPSRPSLVLLVLSFVGFISLGLPDGLLGVGWPSIRASFALPVDALGILLFTFTSGYVIASFISGWILSRLRVGTLLSASCLLTGLSLLAYALAPTWGWMVAAGVLAGFGAGAIDAGINTFAARCFSARLVNLLHAFYGVGAAAGPLIMTAVLAAGHVWQSGYAIVGGIQLLLALCFGVTRHRWPVVQSQAPQHGAARVSLGTTLRLPATRTSIVFFMLYTGTEATAGVWIYSLLANGRGVSTAIAALAVSAFWGGLTGARIVFGMIPIKGNVDRVLSLCLVGIIAGAVLLLCDLHLTTHLAGALVLGFSCGPVFPLLIATTPQRLGAIHTANAVGVQIASAAIGLSAIPGIVGVLAAKYGLEMIAQTLLVLAVLLVLAHSVLARQSGLNARH